MAGEGSYFLLRTGSVVSTQQIWSSAVQFPIEASLSFINPDKVNTSIPYAATVPYTFSIGAAIHKHKTRIYASWAQSDGPENYINEFVRWTYAESAAAPSWSAPATLAADPVGNTNRSHGAFYSDGTTLSFFASSYNGISTADEIFPGLITELWQLSEPTTWSLIGTVCDIYPLEQPKLMANGKYCMGGVDSRARPCVATSNTTDPTGAWTSHRISTPGFPDPSYSEVGTLVEADRILAVIREPSTGAFGSYAFASQSLDNGQSWSSAKRSNYLMQSKKPCVGTLSTGQDYIINDLYGLDNLMLTVKEAADTYFKTLFSLVPGNPAAPQWPDSVHVAGWGYPSATEDLAAGKLHIAFYNAKEDQFCYSIDLAAIKKCTAATVVDYQFNEATGATTLLDYSGNGYDATIHGSPTFDPGKFGNAITITAADQFIELPLIPATKLNQVSPLSYMGWASFSSLSANRTIIAKWDVPNGKACWKLSTHHVNGDKIALFLSPDGGTTASYTADYTAPSTSTFYQYAFSFVPGIGLRFWIDGVEVTPTAETGTLPLALYDRDIPILIGADGSVAAPTTGMRGGLDVGKILNFALTQADVDTHRLNGPPQDYSAYSAEAAALFTAMAFPPTPARAVLYDNLIVGLKADGVWSHLDGLHIFAAADSQAARLDLKLPSRLATVVGAPTFTVDRGYAGDGTSGRLTGPNLSTVGGVYVRDSCHMGVWCNTNVQEANSAIGQGNALIRLRVATDTIQTRANDSSSQNTTGITTSVGLTLWSRGASGSYKIYKDASLVATKSVASAAVANLAINFCAASSATASTQRLPAVFYGDDLSQSVITALYGRLNTFLTAIGANA